MLQSESRSTNAPDERLFIWRTIMAFPPGGLDEEYIPDLREENKKLLWLLRKLIEYTKASAYDSSNVGAQVIIEKAEKVLEERAQWEKVR